ncbi:MAG: metallophosphoesterase [Nitrososphaera sp.]
MRVRRERLAIPALNNGLQGYKILHVSDIHFDEKTRNNKTLWDQLHSDEADLVVITGDFITEERYVNSLIEYLRDLKAKDGILAILGNHDYAFLTMAQHFRHYVMKRPYVQNNWKRLVSLLEKIGIKVLINNFEILKTSAGASLFIEGTDDPVLGSPKISGSSPEYESSDLKILLSHSPDILYSSELKKKKFELLLCGHTHGGQVSLPGIGPLITGTRHARRKESHGTFKASDGMFVNVSSGIGHSLLPIRINCPPELVLIELGH